MFQKQHRLPIAKAFTTESVLFSVFFPGLLDPWGSKSQQLMTMDTWGTVGVMRKEMIEVGDHETSRRLYYKALKTDVLF